MPGFFQDDTTGSLFYPESVISETISSTTNVTEHPVEGQENVQDHAQAQAETMTVVLLISETPLIAPINSPPAQVPSAGGGILPPTPPASSTNTAPRALPRFGGSLGGQETDPYTPFVDVQFSDEGTIDENGVLNFETASTFTVREVIPRDIPVEALNWLRERRGKRLTYYSTKFPEFGTCVITSISTMRTNRGSLSITVELKQVRIAQAQVVQLPPRRRKKRQADPPVDKGAKPAKAPNQTDVGFASGLALGANILGFSF